MAGYTAPTRSIRDSLVDAERRLANANVPTPRVDAELLLAFVMDRPRGRLFMSDPIADDDRIRFESLVARRASRIPLQHLIGEAPFRHLVLAVGPGVFVPRPETETVAEYAIRTLKDLAGADERVVIDLCTGSGAIAIAIATEVPDTNVYAVEVDEVATSWAARNVATYADRISAARSVLTLHQADATTVHDGVLAHLRGCVDLIVTNPPYIPDKAVPRDPEVREHDPALALFGGPDGLDIVRAIAVSATALLRSGGLLVVEHSDEQGEGAGASGVPYVLREAGFLDVKDHKDLSGRDRITTARRV